MNPGITMTRAADQIVVSKTGVERRPKNEYSYDEDDENDNEQPTTEEVEPTKENEKWQ